MKNEVSVSLGHEGIGATITHHKSGDTFRGAENYAYLMKVLMEAYAQAAYGKGQDRHGGNDLPFHEQRMQTISNLIGSVDGMMFQAIKKLTEGANLPTPEARKAEMLGAIVYIAGIVLYMEEYLTPCRGPDFDEEV